MEIATVALAQLAPLPAAAPTITAEPSALATERFAAIMNASDPVGPPPTFSGPLTGVQSPLQGAFTPPVDTSPPTLGNQILSSLRSTTTDFSQKWEHISNGLNATAAQPNITDMLRLQGELLQVSVQYEMVSKAVSRSTQNIDTLVRMS